MVVHNGPARGDFSSEYSIKYLISARSTCHKLLATSRVVFFLTSCQAKEKARYPGQTAKLDFAELFSTM
jgi:hypothetical protein